jgi:hypothetical protein
MLGLPNIHSQSIFAIAKQAHVDLYQLAYRVAENEDVPDPLRETAKALIERIKQQALGPAA